MAYFPGLWFSGKLATRKWRNSSSKKGEPFFQTKWIIFQPSIFGGYVSFQGDNFLLPTRFLHRLTIQDSCDLFFGGKTYIRWVIQVCQVRSEGSVVTLSCLFVWSTLVITFLQICEAFWALWNPLPQHLSHEKKQRILSMKSWLFSRGPCQSLL